MDGLVRSKRSGDLTSILEALRNAKNGDGLASERAMADHLNVKRHQLRRALQVMRASGELEAPEARRKSLSERQGQLLARDTNPIEVIEMRLAIEPMLARLAALRASPVEISRIVKAATTLERSDPGAADLAFHKSIAASTSNNLAAGLYAVLRQVGSDTRLKLQRANPSNPARTRQRDLEHRAIADCIAARDPDGAEQAMRAHLMAVQRLVMDRMLPA
jgi:DNA-binding FadR family transcriptional regulator